MTKSYRNRLNEIRADNDAKANQEKDLRHPDREDQVLGEIELVTDANDLPSEVKKNLESNLGPIDTEAEIEAKGLNKKKTRDDEEYENSSGFRP